MQSEALCGRWSEEGYKYCATPSVTQDDYKHFQSIVEIGALSMRSTGPRATAANGSFGTLHTWMKKNCRRLLNK